MSRTFSFFSIYVNKTRDKKIETLILSTAILHVKKECYNNITII